ncbi:Mannose-binding lectin [Cordyceps fumosorosea ARSEF 2679]|uniref:Mannose-binding lectin n=1 Tax=Cordyceps fumosorosea (strain ARSEF 2679) TaxID=1081104 RepID=A0A168DDB6_CORFA|nr:Mannose-binding lectin [Cordyceps fumosorosea ARSEF 2679]OAA72468.1 Mannose-binding lectin [Cordyceps fumosorosea ARSEF 2679]
MAAPPPKVGNPNQGGTTTAEDADFEISENLNAVNTVTVWVDNGSGSFSNTKLIKAIKVKYGDGTERTKGHTTGTTYSFTFDNNEKMKTMSLWAGARVDRIKWETRGGRTFDHGGTGGSEYTQDVGNGILLGFTGTKDDNELVSLGSIFKEASD